MTRPQTTIRLVGVEEDAWAGIEDWLPEENRELRGRERV